MGYRPFSDQPDSGGAESHSDLPDRPGTWIAARLLDWGRDNARRQSDISLSGAAADERRLGDVLGSHRHFGRVAIEEAGRLGFARRRRVRHGFSYQADRYTFADPTSVQPSFKTQVHSLLPARRAADGGDLCHIQCRHSWPPVAYRILGDQSSRSYDDGRIHGSLQLLSLLDQCDDESIGAALLAGHGGGY